MDTNAITVDTYNHIASKYADTYFDDTEDIPAIDEFLERLTPGANILDAGCGVGQFTKYMRTKGFSVVSIDASDEMLAIAKSKVPDGAFRKMDMRHLTFGPNSFHGILAAYSLIHIPESEIHDTLVGFHRVLAPGGFLLAITQRGVHDHWVDEPFAPGMKVFFNFFTREGIAEDLAAAEFTVLSQTEKDTTDSYSGSDAVIYTVATKGLL